MARPLLSEWTKTNILSNTPDMFVPYRIAQFVDSTDLAMKADVKSGWLDAGSILLLPCRRQARAAKPCFFRDHVETKSCVRLTAKAACYLPKRAVLVPS